MGTRVRIPLGLPDDGTRLTSGYDPKDEHNYGDAGQTTVNAGIDVKGVTVGAHRTYTRPSEKHGGGRPSTTDHYAMWKSLTGPKGDARDLDLAEIWYTASGSHFGWTGQWKVWIDHGSGAPTC